VYGFTTMELSFPFDLRTDAAAAEQMVRGIFAAGYPNLSSMAGLAITGPGVPIELEFGLDLLLDGLERHLAAIGSSADTGAGPGGPDREGQR
jgi:hypothetical protein